MDEDCFFGYQTTGLLFVVKWLPRRGRAPIQLVLYPSNIGETSRQQIFYSS